MFGIGKIFDKATGLEREFGPVQINGIQLLCQICRHDEFWHQSAQLHTGLATLFDAHAFDALIVAAPPKFLGLLRSALAIPRDHIFARVIAWHEKDYTSITSVAELSERLAIADQPTF